jgi:uncharacterized protein (TIGR00290 family)
MVRVVVSWSGGKDSCLACYKAILNGFKVSCLLNIISKENMVMSHGVNSNLIIAQSEAIGIPIIQREATWETYEKIFKDTLIELKKSMHIEAAVFGDIDIQEHLNWVNRVCKEVELTPIEPLWHLNRGDILTDFINAGFEAILVNVKADIFGKEWLGRKINRGIIKDFKKLQKSHNFDICGEFGEYHTLVVDGLIFNKRLKILKSKKVLKEGYWKYWSLEIFDYILEEKHK